MSNVTARDVEALIEIFDGSDWEELHLEIGGLTLDLSKRGSRPPLHARARSEEPEPASTPAAVLAAAAMPAPAHHAASVEGAQIPAGWVAVLAPSLGTFYRAPKPGAPPYVELGREVTPGTEVCLIEVMKLFTAVTAGVRGVVRRVCVADGEMVEFNQPLILIEPKN